MKDFDYRSCNQISRYVASEALLLENYEEKPEMS